MPVDKFRLEKVLIIGDLDLHDDDRLAMIGSAGIITDSWTWNVAQMHLRLITLSRATGLTKKT